MKKKLTGLGVLLALISMSACNGGSSTTSTDSTTVAVDSTQTSSANTSTPNMVKLHFDPSASYVDLKTGKPVKLRVDTVTKYIVNEVTNQPINYYINPATKDTFDQRGRLVSHALIRGSNGDYSIDETRISTTTDDNSNAISSGDTTSNMTTDGTMGSGDSKTKIKDDKFKQKTDSTKIKVKEGKIKIKTNND